MKTDRTFRRTIRATGVVLLLSGMACAAPQAGLSGTVKGSAGAPVPAASIVLHCLGDENRDVHTASGQDGSYELKGLAACNYTVTASAEGYSPSPPVVLAIKDARHLRQDIVLARPNAARTTQDRPSFQAAGIHGLIDPGGYSASATAGAASNVLNDVSGVQRDSSAPGIDGLAVDCSTLSQRTATARQHPEDWQANAEAGRSLLQSRAPVTALPYLLRADELAPASASDVRLDVAETLVLTGRFADALTRLSALSLLHPGPRYYALRARAEEGLGDFDAAIHDRSQAVRQSSTPDNIFALAYEHLLAGHVDQTERIFRDGLTRFPQSVALMVGLGAADFFQHNYASAQGLLLQAAQQDPRDRRPYPLLADISRIPDADTAGVPQAMERHLAVDAEDAKGNAALGSFLLLHTSSGLSQATETGASPPLQRAEQLLQRALALDPGLTQARADLATLYHRDHRSGQEAEQLARVALEKPSRDVQYRLGLAYRDSGQPELARRTLEKARNVSDSSGENMAHIASLLSVSPAGTAALPCKDKVPQDAQGAR